MAFSRPEYWSGETFPSPEDLPNLGTEPRSPTLQADSLPAEPQEKPGEGPRQLQPLGWGCAEGVSAPWSSRGADGWARPAAGTLRVTRGWAAWSSTPTLTVA